MKRNPANCQEKKCYLCRHCLPAWIPAIEANKRALVYKKGDRIFNEGEAVKGMYFVNRGTVKIHKKWGGEKELIVRFAKGGDIIGHRGLGENMHYPVSATTLEPSVICFVDLELFRTTLAVNIDLTIDLLMFYAEELQRSEKSMSNLAHMQVKGRIAFCLLALKTKFGEAPDGSINLFLSRQDLASYAGTTYETVFRVLTEFVLEKWIRLNNKSISILNEQALVLLAREG